MNQGLKDFLEMLTPEYRLFVTRLDLILTKIEKEEFHCRGKYLA